MPLTRSALKSHLDRERKKAKGECVFCGCHESPETDKTLCTKHLDALAEYGKAYYKRKRLLAMEAAFGAWWEENGCPFSACGVNRYNAWEIWQAAIAKKRAA